MRVKYTSANNIDAHIFGRELIDDKAVQQFFDCLRAPGVIRGAAMPDMHLGYTMPIGGVIETFDVIYPSWVGYDIGCGVCYVETTYKLDEVKSLKKEIYEAIHSVVPSGFKHHSTPVTTFWPMSGASDWFTENFEARGGNNQLGTLGSGNHFIEIGYNIFNKVCIVIHSGSRGIGHDTASRYMRLANPSGKLSEGSYPLYMYDNDGEDYIKDMEHCLAFALCNRETMIHRIDHAMFSLGLVGGVEWGSLINNTHNHAEVEHDRIIHRKGATKAGLGEAGVIPAQSKVGSFIVRGRGVSESLCSASRGAGRAGSRKKAKDTLSVEDFENDMDGIMAHVGRATLDEAPRAYKDPALVMAAQTDLVTVVNMVQPLICIKGIKPPRKKRGRKI
jgi:tRNA-splicing ligase RtcB